MWLMLQQEKPEDLVIATGKMISVREFVELAAKHVGFKMVWEGEGQNEKGYDANSGKLIVEVDERYFRPAEVDLLIGDPSRAKERLGWEPQVGIEELVEIMMQNDIQEAQRKVRYAQNI
jgi:GDPmannose 4,6-dehydratase